MSEPTITVDVGTTSVKLGLFDVDGTLLASGRRPTPTTTDGVGEVYDVPALLACVTGFVAGLTAAQRAGVRRLALAGVGESGGLVRPDLTLASPMILWHDQRGAARLARLAPGERTRVTEVTGLPVSANYALSKTAWALERADRTDDVRWLNVAEHLAAVLTGERWAEPSLASRTMALDLRTRSWSSEVCDLLGVDVGVFPELRSAADGRPLTAAFAAEVGLDPEVLVHVAGHDHVVGGAGAGLRPGEVLNSTGTTEGVLVLRATPDVAAAERSRLANGLACAGSAYTLFASIPTGGSAFATLQSLLGLDAARLGACVADLHARWVAGDVDLARVPLVLPQFRGSAPPAKDPRARGLVSGIAGDTSVEEVVLGCFLGLARQLADVLALFDVPARQVKVIGPAAANPLWLQLKADLLGTPLSASRFGEVVSRSAQVLAVGATASWEQTDPRDVDVDAAAHERLQDWRAATAARWEHLRATPS